MPNSLAKAFEPDGPTIGFLNDRWIDTCEMSISISDLGFRQAVTAVERLRTYNGKVFQVDAHLDRWRQSTSQLAIHALPSAARIKALLDELIARNRLTLDAWQETGITVFATPGSIAAKQPTFAIHMNPLDLRGNRRRQQAGQPLVITDIKQPPPESWPRGIKVRCRLHYYLADQIAGSWLPGAVGVLIDDDKTITETSIANVAIVESGTIVSPPPERILGGITQSVVERIAETHHLSWNKELISVDRMQNADEVLLMGTDTGIWFANRINGQPINLEEPGPVYRELYDEFDRLTSNF